MPRLLDGITAALRHLGARQEVIARNIANADTPGFKAQTLKSPDFGALVREGQGSGQPPRPTVRPTAAMVALGARPAATARTIADRSVSEIKPDGNTVTLEDQLMQMGEVQADYATLTSLYRKQMGLIRTALGSRGG